MELIMKKMSFFLIGMTSLVLAFAMTGCPQGTNTVTKTEYVNTGGGERIKDVPTPVIASGPDAVKAFLKGELGGNVKTLYIQKSIELEGDYALAGDKTIVITDEPLATLNTLTLPNTGALFVITETTTNAVLTVKGTLKLEGNSKVVLGSETVEKWSGKLTIAGGGAVIVASTALIPITTASRIVLDEENSVLTFLDERATNVKVVGSLGSDEKKVGVKDKDKSIIVIPESGKAALGATETNLGGGTNTGLDDIELTAASTATANDIGELFKGDVTTVTYTGTGALTSSLELDKGQTLIVNGDLTVSGTGVTLTADAGAALTVPNGAKLTAKDKGTIDISALFDPPTTEVGGSIPSGGGTLDGGVTLNGELLVESGSTLKLSHGNGTGKIPEIAFGAEGSLKIAHGGKVTLADGPDEGAKDEVYVGTTTDTDPKPFYTWTGSASEDQYIQLDKDRTTLHGNLKVTGEISVNYQAAVADGYTLTVADDGILDLSKLYLDASNNKPIALEGSNSKIVVADEGTLRLSMGNGSGLPPEIDWSKGGSLKIEKGGSVTLNTGTEPDITYIGTGGLYAWGDSGSVTLSKGNMLLEGEITLNSADTIHAGMTATVAKGAEFTVKQSWYEAAGTLDILGTVKLEETEGMGAELFPGNSDGNGQIIIRDGGSVEFAAASRISYPSPTYGDTQIYHVLVTITASNALNTPTKAKVEKSAGATPVWTVTSDGTGTDLASDPGPIILGESKLDFDDTAEGGVDKDQCEPAGSSKATGVLKAAQGTAIIFTLPAPTE
jgi:hypothetical protein